MQKSSSNTDALAVALRANPMGWLKSPPFDLTLIVGVAAIALISGWITLIWPQLFVTVLMIDLWILGYHHVVSTYTRLAFDLDSFRQYKFIAVVLPFIVAAFTAGLLYVFGPWIIATTYFYWQWFHYTRQSYGIGKVYQIKAGLKPSQLDQWVIYSLPLSGIMYRSYQDPGYFLWMELRVIPVPFWAFALAFAVSVVVIFVWVYQQILAYREGRFASAYCLYMLSHFIIFYFGYLHIRSINEGWLVLNVWHNAQYVLFVWMFHNNRFKNQIDPKRRFLSTLSQSKNQWLYYGLCLAISTFIYKIITDAYGSIEFETIPMILLVIYQAINFHLERQILSHLSFVSAISQISHH